MTIEGIDEDDGCTGDCCTGPDRRPTNTRPVRQEEHLMSDHPQSCRSEEGITVGLVDALIGIMRVLAPRDLSAPSVQEALADLLEDPDFHTVRRGWRSQPGILARIRAALLRRIPVRPDVAS